MTPGVGRRGQGWGVSFREEQTSNLGQVGSWLQTPPAGKEGFKAARQEGCNTNFI
jgi:hypothetical protein